MNDRLLDKYLTRKPEDREVAHAEHDQSSVDAGSTDDLGCFGWLRGVRDRAVMLELRRKDGTIAAFSYAYLERVDFDPSEGITLHMLGRTIRIKGRALNAEVRPQVRLFHGIARHRVPWIRQSQDTPQLEGSNVPAIESITW